MCNTIQHHTGDVLKITQRPLMIANVVNDQGLYNAGIASQIRMSLPWAYEGYASAHMRLGDVVVIECEGLYIAHLCAMNGVRTRHNQTPLNMLALRSCLEQLCNAANRLGFDSVAMPKIGAGLAGGDWREIERMIGFWFGMSSLTAHVYTLEA